MNPNAVPFTEQERATVLAALRLWQYQHAHRPKRDIPQIYQWHFASVEPMSVGEIDALCQRINGA